MSRSAGTSSISCKSLFSSGKSSKTSATSTEDSKNIILHRIHIGCEVNKVQAALLEEQEENRIKYLKDLLEEVDQEDWKYEPIDSLIGLQHQ